MPNEDTTILGGIMKSIGLAAIGLLAAMAAANAAATQAKDIDVAAFANGALIDHASSVWGSDWAPIQLLDEDPQTGWATAKDPKIPIEIVISLPERSEIHALEFDTRSIEKRKYGAKDIDIFISDQSATSGYKALASVTLKVADHQRFAVATPGVGRWLKLDIKNNIGNSHYTEIMNVKAFGVELTHTPLPNVSGTYVSQRYGKFHLSQNGAQVSGCYEFHGGLFQGGLEAHLMRLTWTQVEKDPRLRRGPALMVLERNGRDFLGFWRYDSEKRWRGSWNLRKLSNRIGSCPNWNPKGESGNIVASSLAKEGRVRLYGINFDTDSDRLRSDARPTLEQLTQALRANPAWHVVIEGHTDSTGTSAHNLDLSKRRAASVKAYLVAAGIAATRMTTAGYGERRPVASNDTAIGRAQNRRVEIVRH